MFCVPCGRARICASVICIILFLFSSPFQVSQASEKKWQAWYDIGGFYNSDDASRGEVTLFLPLAQTPSSLTFFEASGKFFEEDAQEGNFALGYRQMLSNGFNFGAWIGVDGRLTEIDNSFWQLSGGFEMLSHDFDARVNWYGPVTDPQTAGDPGFTQVVLQGNNIFMLGGEEVALYGVDGEIGARIPLEAMNLNPGNVELRIYGGAFHFDHEDAFEDITGGKGRLELRLNDVFASIPGSRLTAEYEFSYDDVREERHEVGLRLRLPFSKDAVTGKEVQYATLNNQERRMLDGIERDLDIITTRSKAEKVEDAITNVDFDRVAYVNDGGSITTTSTNEGDNRLIIVNGSIIDGTQVVQANQTVMGGGSIIQVRGLKSGVVANFRAPGSTPIVRNNGVGNVIRLAGNNIHIDGLRINGNDNGNNGVAAGSDKNNIAITQNIIRRTRDDAIDFNDDNSNILISGNIIRNVNEDGIDFENRNSNVIIANNFIRTRRETIDLYNRNTNFLITNNTLRSNSEDIIEFNNLNSVIISANTLVRTGNGFEGIEFRDDNNVQILGNIFGFMRDRAIEFDDDNTVTISNNIFNGPITNFLLDVNGTGNELSGEGNIANVLVTCQSGTFNGSVTFANTGTVLQDGIAPCN